MNKLKNIWYNLNSSLWFLPSLMILGAMLTAYGLVRLDLLIGSKWTSRYPLLFGAGAAGARGMLAAIAGSMITVAGLIFSLTLSTLAQVASQYTSRLLRNFMRDRANQLVMGSFVSVFVYCLVVLRTIRGGDEGAFVPSLATAFGLLLALGSIGMLIFFIHHIASSIQAATVIADAADETEELLNKLFPSKLGDTASPQAQADLHQADLLHWVPAVAPKSGYVQGIDNDTLLDYACEANVLVRMERALGSFVAQGSTLAVVASYAGAPPDEESLHRLVDCFSLGNQRTLSQDFGFGLRQLVDIALKALSPGINDTSTAVMCLDRLGALLALLTERNLGDPHRAAQGRVRVIALRPDFASYVATAFDQIRANADESVAIYLRLLAALCTVAQRTTRPDYRQALCHQADLALAAAEQKLTVAYDLDQVHAQFGELQAALANKNAPAGEPGREFAKE